MRRIARSGALVALLVSVSACERIILEGRSTNAQGEALPGVVVRLAGTDNQDLTDGLGRYRLTVRRDAPSARLEFSKSGYARAELSIAPRGRLRVQAPDAALWLLPPNPGVYSVHNYRYVQSDWVLPKQYYLKDGSAVYGVELPEELHAVSDVADPFIACFRTPRYNARLARLVPAEAIVPGLESGAIPIWVELSSIDAGLQPVDEPEGSLQRVVVDWSLQPGVYGIHWGAMEGYTTLESRVFVFRLEESAAPEGDEELSGEEGEPQDDSAAVEGNEVAVTPADEEAPPVTDDLIEPSPESRPAPPQR